ncbi:MAG: IS3 family transposase [Solirubrobacterales bacterium]
MSMLAATETEVSSKAQRRRFTAEYKRKVLQEAAVCTKSGEIAALLRREGLYSSHLAAWRRLREQGERAGLAAKKRGPKARAADERDRTIAAQQREIARLTEKLERAEIIIDVQKKVGRLLGIEMPPGSALHGEEVMRAVEAHGTRVGVAPLCRALGSARATYYRRRSAKPPACRLPCPRALSRVERQAVLDTLHAPRFVDLSPAEVHATLLDEGTYLCSERTLYRILEANREVRERRDQRRHPVYTKPELLATAPNQLWSWDITKLLGPQKWSYFHLYVILDVFSRYIVGWLVADRESAALAQRLIDETCRRQKVPPGQLTIHADRGSSMTSKPVAFLLADLGVTKTHSRPHVSDDNPFSEAHFKTLKYRPDFPGRFGCIEDARSFSSDFFSWYNTEHHHSGIGLLTPHDVHHGLAGARREQRALVLTAAHEAHPERFPHGVPSPAPLPTAVWINKPRDTRKEEIRV